MANVREKVQGLSASTGVSPALRYIGGNPIAFGLIGAGVGVLLFGSRRASAYCSTGSFDQGGYESGASRYAAAASQTAAGIKSKASEAAATAGQRARKVGQQVRNTAQNASGQAASAFDSSPLLLGIAALAAGAVVGLALPGTQVEGEYLGGASERVIDRAKTAARDAADRAQRAAQDTGRELKQKAKEAIGVSEPGRQRETEPAAY